MDPIWILEIKTSDSVRGELLSSGEAVEESMDKQGRKENGKFAEKETGIYCNKKSNY